MFGMQKEEVINTETGKFLESHLYDARVLIEQSGQLEDRSKRPDLIIRRRGREPLLIENKIGDSRALTDQCLERLNLNWSDGRPVRVVVGLLSPKSLSGVNGAADLGAETGFRWAAWGRSFGRFPASGWLSGSLIDLAGFLDRIGADAVNIDDLIAKIRQALQQASLLLVEDRHSPANFSRILKQKPSQQTNRMGLAMIFNAIVFQSHIAKNHGNIASPSQLKGESDINQADLVLIWRDILGINYSPIFYIARELLQSIADTKVANLVLRRLFETAITTAQESGSHGLIGTIFGELISDRKLLASFYTLPPSATLIAEIAINRLDIDWSSRRSIESLKVADLAVGTGTLLVAVHKRIAERHLLCRKDPGKLHRAMMEAVLVGCDIDPSAVHIAAARLSGEFPDIDYHSTQTYVMPYGYVRLKKRAREYKLGSLDLFNDVGQISLFGSGLEALAAKGTTSHAEVDIPAESLDLVIMNPPFTRPTNHEVFQEGFPNPQFAGMGNDAADQKKMSQILKGFLKDVPEPRASHGNAGLASNFMDLAHLKLKPGGVLALIVPATVVSGNSWSNMRRLLSERYRDITVISIGSGNGNWSADTSLNEVIIVATKSAPDEDESGRANFVVCKDRPATITEAAEVAKTIEKSKPGGYLEIGGEQVGWCLGGLLTPEAAGHPSNVRSMDLALFASKLVQGVLVLPRLRAIPLPITSLGQLGVVGPVHRDINGFYPDKSLRGPFDIIKLDDRGKYKSISYPVLWAHANQLERTMSLSPDSEGIIRPKMRDAALRIWSGYQGGRQFAGASKIHINCDFGLMAHSLGACLTPCLTIGGRAWPSFQIKSQLQAIESEKALVVWLNTTIGLIGRWWTSSRQQPGRSIVSVSTIPKIPSIDLGKMAPTKIKMLAAIFDDYALKELKSAGKLDADKIRESIDELVLCDVLGLPVEVLKPLAVIRSQWCSEPSVRGS